MDFKPVKQAVSAVHSGKYSSSHVATLRKAGQFMAANKGHAWHKSGALRSAMKKTQTVRGGVVAGADDFFNLAEGLYLYGGVGQRMRSPYGPKYGHGQRMRPKFPPRILSPQLQKKIALPINVRLKALEALKKQTMFPNKPTAAPAAPKRLREAEMQKKSRLQRKLEVSAKTRGAKTRQVAGDKRARRGYRMRMAMSRGQYALGGAAKGAFWGGVVGGALKKMNPEYFDAGQFKKRTGKDVVGVTMAIGSGLGAARGFKKASSSWHQSRRHGQAIDKSYAKLADRRYKKRFKTAKKNFGEETMTREELIESIIGKAKKAMAAKKAQRGLRKQFKGAAKKAREAGISKDVLRFGARKLPKSFQKHIK
jgi:hypothetical protein